MATIKKGLKKAQEGEKLAPTYTNPRGKKYSLPQGASGPLEITRPNGSTRTIENREKYTKKMKRVFDRNTVDGVRQGTMEYEKGGIVKKKMKNGGAMLRQAPKSTMEKISSTKLKDVPEKAVNVAKKVYKSGKDAVKNTINKVKNTTVGEAAENTLELFTGYNPNRKPTKKPNPVLAAMARKNGGKVGKMRNGGSLSGLKASNKRVGPIDPKGAFTKVQKKTLRGAKGKASLTKDKQLGATKMTAKFGAKMKKGKSC